MAYGSLALAALLGLALAAPRPALAETLVKFNSAASGGGAPAPLQGYLTKPKGAGPFPAVVLLHSCLGLPSARRAIGETFAGWGYVALFVDDFGPRGLKETCAVDFPEGLPDAYGALAFVASLPYVDAARIAAIGYSQGADTALKLAAAPQGAVGVRFRAAAALYPPCDNEANARLAIPTLILVGAADDVTPAAACERLASAQPGGDAVVKLVVYPGARHGFDLPEFAGGKRVLGMRLEYDPAAAAKSRAELRAFLAARLAR